MVVLSVALGSREGKLLLSRNYADISRTLVEDCVKSLPRLIKEGQQHTYVDHNNLRLNYLPMDKLYLISISDKNSNILEDIEIVRTLQNILTQVLSSGINERQVCDNSIDLILAIDDVISLGHRNICSESMVLSALEMESSNEKMHNAMMDTRVKAAKKKADAFLKEMKKKKKKGEESPLDFGGSGSGSGPVTGGGGSSVDDVLGNARTEEEEKQEKAKKSKVLGKKGLTLGAKKKKQRIREAKEKQKALQKALKEDEDDSVPFNPLDASVSFKHQETISGELDKEGKMSSFAVKGNLSFMINNPQKQRIAVLIDKPKMNEKVKLKVPPSFNKDAWKNDYVIIPRNENLKLNIRTKIPAVKYNFSKSKGQYMPFTLSIWFTDGSLSMEVEFNGQQSWTKKITNVRFKIPGVEGEPEVEDTIESSFHYSEEDSECVWTIPELSEDNEDASIILNFGDSVAEEDLYPWSVDFELPQPFVSLQVAGCRCLETDEELKIEQEYQLGVQGLSVVYE